MNLEKTIRLTNLFDFYESLLTEKQKSYMALYYEDDLSLGEIAEQFAVSRQAVYDNIRRTGKVLEDYENKLRLYEKYVKRQVYFEKLRIFSEQNHLCELKEILEQLESIE